MNITTEPGTNSKNNYFMKKILIKDKLFSILGDILVVNTNWWQHSTSVHQDLSISITNEYN